MSDLAHISAPAGVAPGNGYSQVVSGTGRLIAISGQIALDEQGQLVGRDDPEAQARQIFHNLKLCLAAAGAGFEDVVKFTFFVIDVADLPAIRRARDEVIDVSRPPASTAVQVAALFAPDFRIEIEALAMITD